MTELDNSGIWLVHAKQDLDSSGLIWRILQTEIRLIIYALIILRSWMFTITVDLSEVFRNLDF